MVLKGISPLIATVLLIAVTMTLAGVLAYWASTFVKSGLEVSSNQTVSTECNFGNFVVEACSYDNAAQKVSFILNNIGTVGLSNITVFTIYPDNSLNFTQLNGTLPSSRLVPFTVNGVVPGFSKLTIRTSCPNVFEDTICR